MSQENPKPTASAERTRVALRWVLIAALVAAVGWAAGTSFVMVDETEFVIVERLGRLSAVYDRPEDRGLHFKLPWPIDSVRRFDSRVQLFDPPGREMFTRDKENITVDAYVCWRISPATENEAEQVDDRPVVQYFRSLGNADVAQARIDTRVRSVLTAAIGRVDFSRLLNVNQSDAGPEPDQRGMLERLSEQIRDEVRQQAGEERSLADQVGIEIVDVRIQRINLPIGNQQAVFERMKSERRKDAERYRSEGMAENAVIRARANRHYDEVIARANAEAERIQGRAEAEAARILNSAHAAAPDFYEIHRTLNAYRKIINERTTLVLSADSPMLRLLTRGLDADWDEPIQPDTPPAGIDSTRQPPAKESSGTAGPS